MTRVPRADRAVLAAVALCLVHFASFEIVHSPIVWDTRYYLYHASRVAHGAVPYRDFFELKMPLSIFVGALFHRMGLVAGLQPIHVIRAGYLMLAAAAGIALFLVHRRLEQGRSAPGFLALGAYVAFPLLGALPAIGVCPKTLVALFAPLAALAVSGRNFLLAGACGALAFFDWQVGGLAALGALAGALGTPGNRLRSAVRVIAGGLLAATPILVYFLINGGIRQALGQTMGTLLDRGKEMSRRSLPDGVAVIARNLHVACSGQEWLFAVGIVGMLIYPVWVWRRRNDTAWGMTLTLAVYHYGLVGFSLFDFQSYFDLYILACTVAFFAGVALVEALALVRRGFAAEHHRVIGWAAALMMIAVARPAWVGTRPNLAPPTVDAAATLEDQKQVYERVMSAAAGRRIAFLAAAELPFLGERASVAPFIYWDTAAYLYYRQEGETYLEPRDRILREVGAEIMVGDRTLPPESGDILIASDNRAYQVTLRPLR